MKTLFLALSVLFASPSHAGGSVSFQEDMKPLLEKAGETALLKSLEAFQISDSGSATRLGKQTGLGGARVCPCTFEVHSGGSLKGRLEIRTDWKLVNIHGQTVSLTSPDAAILDQDFTSLSLDFQKDER